MRVLRGHRQEIPGPYLAVQLTGDGIGDGSELKNFITVSDGDTWLCVVLDDQEATWLRQSGDAVIVPGLTALVQQPTVGREVQHAL